VVGMQGLGAVALSRTKNPSISPFTKGDLQFPPLEKGGEGGFSEKQNLSKFIHSRDANFDVAMG
jgi:hypothetical protein